MILTTQYDLIRTRLEECLTLHCMLDPEGYHPHLDTSMSLTHTDGDVEEEPVPSIDHNIKKVGTSIFVDFIARGLLGQQQDAFIDASLKLISSSHTSIYNNTYAYSLRILYARLPEGDFMSRYNLPFAQRQAAVLLHILFGQTYASSSDWTPVNQACYLLVTMLFMPLIQLFEADHRCFAYSSKSSAAKTAAKHSDQLSLISKPTIYKHMFEHLAHMFKTTGVPPVWLSEGNFDMILGRLQDFMRRRSSHSKESIATAMRLLLEEQKNEIFFGAFQSARGEDSAKQRQIRKKMGKVMMRPLVFDNALWIKLSSAFESVLIQLTASNLGDYLKEIYFAGSSVHVLADHSRADVQQMLSTTPQLQAAHNAGTLWFFCTCKGPLEHTSPCRMALDSTEQNSIV